MTDDFDAFFARAVALGELTEAELDRITDECARGDRKEADLVERFRVSINGHAGQCRICLEEEEHALLLQPCNCLFVHRRCLDMWQSRGRAPTCEVCKTPWKISLSEDSFAAMLAMGKLASKAVDLMLQGGPVTELRELLTPRLCTYRVALSHWPVLADALGATGKDIYATLLHIAVALMNPLAVLAILEVGHQKDFVDGRIAGLGYTALMLAVRCPRHVDQGGDMHRIMDALLKAGAAPHAKLDAESYGFSSAVPRAVFGAAEPRMDRAHEDDMLLPID